MISCRLIPDRKCKQCGFHMVMLVKYSNNERTVECQHCGHFIAEINTETKLKAVEAEIQRRLKAEPTKRATDVHREPELVTTGHKESKGLGDLTW